MRRLMSIAAMALLLSVPLWAQRGGHAGFAGGHGGGFAGHAAFSGGRVGGAHFANGMRSGAPFSRTFTRTTRPGFAREPFLHNGFHGNRFHRGFDGRFRGRHFRNNCFGYGCWGYGYPWLYGGYWDPWWWDSGSSYDEDYERDRALAAQMNEQSLEQQRMLDQEQVDRDHNAYARSTVSPSPAADTEPQGTPIVPDTILVFRDQHRKEIQNYAIVGQTLWSFSSARTEKIPLSELDLPATAKANDDRGVTFRVPTGNEGQ